jgi:hypothetical protein
MLNLLGEAPAVELGTAAVPEERSPEDVRKETR